MTTLFDEGFEPGPVRFATADGRPSFTKRAKTALEEFGAGAAAVGRTIAGPSIAYYELATKPDQRERFVSALEAADQATLLTGTMSSRTVAFETAYDQIIERAKELTGVQLENPFRQGYLDELMNADRAAGRAPTLTTGPRPIPVYEYYRPRAEAMFQARLAELRQKNPEVAAQLFFDAPMTAGRLARQASDASTAAMADTVIDPTLKLGAWLLGSISGSRRDPLTLLSLFLGPEGAVGKSVLARIATAALSQGAINAGITAAEQPATEAWRRDAGLPAGPGMLQEIGLGFLFGAIPGAAIRGAGELFRFARPLRDAVNGRLDPQDAPDVLDALGVDEPAAAAAIRDAEDAVVARGEIPPELDPATTARAAEQTAIRGDTDEIPAPDVPRATRPADPEFSKLTDPAAGPRVEIAGKPATMERFDPRQLGTDAVTFQYKGGGDAAGVTNRLANVKRWDPVASSKVVVFERTDGTRVIADGHQRLGLAKRLLEEDPSQPITLDGFLFREADGWTPADVRALAAKKNLQEGSGTALDAARVLRDRPELLDASLPTTGPMMRTALGLSRLSPDGFGMVLNGIVPENLAAHVGAMAPDPATHAGLLDELARSGISTERDARLFVTDALAAGVRVEEQVDLFGAATVTRSLFGERSRILGATIQRLGSDARLFGTLAKRADVIEAAGNHLDRTKNADRAAMAGAIGEVLARVAQRSGPVSDMLNRLALQLAEGKVSVKTASDQLVADITAKLDDGGLAGLLAEPKLEAPIATEPAAAGIPRSPEEPSLFDLNTTQHQVIGEADATDTAAFYANRPERTFDEIYAAADTRQAELNAAGADIAASVGAKFKAAKPKKRETAEAKMARKGYRSTNQLTDIVRAGFVVDRPGQGDAIVNQLAERYMVLDEGWAVNNEGYFDRKVLVRFDDGTIGEIQLWEPHLLHAKDKLGGHKLYSEQRNLPPEDQRFNVLGQQMRDLYSAALAEADPSWRSMLETSRSPKPRVLKYDRQYGSGQTAAVWDTSAPSTLDQPSPGASTANAAPRSESTAGLKSQFTNDQAISTSDTTNIAAAANNATTSSGQVDAGPTLFDTIPAGGDDRRTTAQLITLQAAEEDAAARDLFGDLAEGCPLED